MDLRKNEWDSSTAKVLIFLLGILVGVIWEEETYDLPPENIWLERQNKESVSIMVAYRDDGLVYEFSADCEHFREGEDYFFDYSYARNQSRNKR
ncbi:hypothetical protein LCGC14_2513760 [marine sediment metagenome]|uniref:Uncharacterized protein n=1 Tax=marine sediment metagenome TaxID=412755 RepID=A0A0F9AYW0_9ZZZZ